MKNWIDHSVLAASVLLILLGTIVVVGWLTHTDLYIQVYKTFPPMQFNTALLFIFSGLALIFLVTAPKKSLILGLFITITSTLILAQYIIAINFGIDELLIKAYLPINAEHPGRISSNAALCFLLIGLVITIQASSINKWLTHLAFILCLLIVSISLVALVGYVFGITSSYSGSKWNLMALHTSCGLAIAGIALTVHFLKNSQEDRLKYLPYGVLIFCCMFFLILWQSLIKYQREETLQVLTEFTEQTSHHFSEMISKYDLAFTRMQKRLQRSDNTSLDFWISDAKEYLLDFTSIVSISLVQQNGSNLNIQSMVEQNNLEFKRNELQANTKSCLEQRKLTTPSFTGVNKFIFLKNDNTKLCMIYDTDKLNKKSYLVAILDLPALTKRILTIGLNQGYEIALLNQYREVFTLTTTHHTLKNQWNVIKPIYYPGLNLQIMIWPNHNTLHKLQGYLPNASLIAGVILVIFLSFTIWLLQKTYRIKSELLLSEEKLQRIIDGSKDYALIMLDKAGFIATWNIGAENIFGFNAAEMLGKHFSIFFAKDTNMVSNISYLLTEAKNKGKAEDEGWKLKKNGRKFFASAIFTPLVNNDGAVINFIVLIRDLSERKLHEDSIKDLNQQLQAILNSSHLSIIATDLHGKITHFNHGAQKILKYTAEEMVNKQTPQIFHDPNEVKKRAAELTNKLNRNIPPGFLTFISDLSNGVDEREWTYISKLGERIPVLLSITALQGTDDNICGYVGIAIDISERKEIDRVKNEFISMVSHELRTPLTSIHGSISLLADNVVGEQTKEAMELITIALKNTERLIRLINDILDIEKIESGKMDFNLKPLDVADLIEEAIGGNLSYAHKFSVKIAYKQEIPVGIKANIDHDRFIQVITNLLSNAIKFSPKDEEVELATSLEGDNIKIAITDKGEGIPEKFKSLIFQKFSQADSSAIRKQQGTGLGLNISKLIIENLGGTINYVSTLKKGTTFFITLPIYKAENPNDTSAQQVDYAFKPTILICESDEKLAALIKEVAVAQEFHPILVKRLSDVPEKLNMQHIDALMLHFDLSKNSGEEILYTINNKAQHHDIPVIIISNNLKNIDLLNFDKLANCMQMPINKQQLIYTMGSLKKNLSDNIKNILYVEDDPDLTKVVTSVLKKECNVMHADSLQSARKILETHSIQVVILDLKLGENSGLSLIPEINAKKIPIIIFSAYELPEAYIDQVEMVLMKSKVSNEKLNTMLKTVLRTITKEKQHAEETTGKDYVS